MLCATVTAASMYVYKCVRAIKLINFNIVAVKFIFALFSLVLHTPLNTYDITKIDRAVIIIV